jgi:hypothetical protein
MFKTITVLAGMLAFGAAAQAQTTGVQFGVKSGLSMAVLDGTLNKGADYKPGLHLGGFLRWRPSTHFALQPELVYAQQGCKTESFNGVPFKGKIKLNYLNLPILAKVYLGKVFYLQAGPQFGMLLSAHDVGQKSYSSNGGYTEADVDVKKNYKGDVSLCAGLGIDLPMGLGIATRFNYGLTDINNDAQEEQVRKYLGIGGLHNRVAEVSLSYAFGGK